MRKILYVILSMCLMAVSVADLSAQEDRREVRKGNRRFKDGAFGEAGIEYMRALQKDSMSVAANYNLANALYRQEDYEKAKEALGRIKDVAPMTPDAAAYFYNLGSVAIAQQDWQTAVQAFAQSLLVNPGDLDAKENYIYAKKKLQDQQQNQNDQDQNQDQNQDNQNQDQNQDQNNQDQNQDNQDNQQNDQNNDDQQDNKDNKDNQQSQGQQPQITPQAAQQMLQAIQAKEKETQDKVNKAKAAAMKSRQREKNW
ncbi:MAG: tetratricopeptide repeat protein [Bacteroidales bacterium]|nr:tetratricopeptide repeat protein [Bacteroidales bacterium]